MLLTQLLGFALLAAANPLLSAREPNSGDKQCCKAKCYLKMEYGDSHDQGQFSSYCTSFLKATATPCPTTITSTAYSTQTATVTVTSGQAVRSARAIQMGRDGLEPRNQPSCTTKVSKPTCVPAFAQKDCNEKDLSSACSCLGIQQPKTKTVAQPTVTHTTTKCTTTTKTTTVTPCTSTTTATASVTQSTTVSVTSATLTTTTTIETTATLTATTIVIVSVPVSATLATASFTTAAPPTSVTITTTVATSTITSSVDLTISTTVTTTTTVYPARKRDLQGNAQAVQYRGIDARPLPILPEMNSTLAARGVVPASCIVVTTTSTTTVQATSTASETATITSSVTSASATTTTTATTFITTTYTVTLTESDTATVTPTTTVISSVIATTTTTSTNTITTTVTAISTATAACNVYQFVATSGPRAGQFLQADQPDPNVISYGFVDFTSDPASANSFTLRPDGTVYGGNNVYGWVSDAESLYYILQMTDGSYATYGSEVSHLTCAIGNGDSSYPGAVGTFSCSENGSPVSLVYCDITGNDLLQSTDGGDGCTAANLAALPACS